MKKIILVLFLVSFFHNAFAVNESSIYQAEVLVASQDEKLKDQAIQKAFVQTLSKLSGNSQLLSNPVIKAALPSAQNAVEEIQLWRLGYSCHPLFFKSTV